MATITYNWDTAVSSFFMNDLSTSGAQSQAAVGAFKNGTYFGAWSDPSASGFVEGRLIEADGTPVAAWGTSGTGDRTVAGVSCGLGGQAGDSADATGPKFR